MKGTILGSDFLQTENSVKLLEINTNTTFVNEGSEMLDYDAFFNVLISNNITELHFIYTLGSSYTPMNEGGFRFEEKLMEKCVQNNITYYPYEIPNNSQTVPYIEDNDNRFILRQSYDSMALVDETYCSDKFGLIDLLKDTDIMAKSYFDNPTLGIDQLTELPTNGINTPNFVVKERSPLYDDKIYPAIYELSTLEELSDLKVSLRQDLLLQEFVYDESNLVDGRWSVIRSIDIIYGSDLDMINLGGYKTSTILPVDSFENEFEPDTKKYNQKTRYKYINKQIGNFFDVTYHLDADSFIPMSDGSLKTIQDLQVNDSIKSLAFTDVNGLRGSTSDDVLTYWEGTFEKTLETLSNVDTNVTSIQSKYVTTFFINVTLENGVTWVDSPSSTFYIEENNSLSTRWDILNKLVIGDKIIVKDKITGELSRQAITNLSMEYFEKMVYEIDVEPYDVYLTDISDNLYAIMHNSCDCCTWSFCGEWCCATWCSQCFGEVIK
jgi:hypothetical protein